jgi:hypothetical protein
MTNKILVTIMIIKLVITYPQQHDLHAIVSKHHPHPKYFVELVK